MAFDRFATLARSGARRAREVYAVEGVGGVLRRGRDWNRRRKAVNAAASMLPREPLPGPPHWHTHVLSVAERSLPQCYHYRVEQKREICALLGVPFDDIGMADLSEVLTRLQLASVLIVYRLPGSRMLDAVVAEAQRLHVPVIYEVDDLVYRRELIAANPNLQTLPRSLRSAVIAGSDDYLAGLRSAQANLASTQPLADDMSSVNGGRGFVIENGIDNTMLEIAEGLAVEPFHDTDADEWVVTYGSGSRAHDLDFALVAPALAQWMSSVPQGRLKVIGPVGIPAELRPFTARIVQIADTLPYGEYLRELHRSTVAIAPLTDDRFNAYKSHVKYLEAGLVGVPIVASPTVYSNYIQNGRTGIIATDHDEWVTALTDLCADSGLRARMAAAARDHVRMWELRNRPREQMGALLEALRPAVAGVRT